MAHYNEALRYFENAGDIYRAAGTRRNVAVTLQQSGQLDHALLYAQAVLRNFQQYGEAARAEQEKTEGLIGEIKDESGKMKDEGYYSATRK